MLLLLLLLNKRRTGVVDVDGLEGLVERRGCVPYVYGAAIIIIIIIIIIIMIIIMIMIMIMIIAKFS